MQIWGTQPADIDRAEDRDLWYDVLTRLDIKQPPGTMVTDEQSALKASAELGYPVMVRPSFVLGGRAMEIVYRSGRPSRFLPCTMCLLTVVPTCERSTWSACVQASATYAPGERKHVQVCHDDPAVSFERRVCYAS